MQLMARFQSEVEARSLGWNRSPQTVEYPAAAGGNLTHITPSCD